MRFPPKGPPKTVLARKWIGATCPGFWAKPCLSAERGFFARQERLQPRCCLHTATHRLNTSSPALSWAQPVPGASAPNQHCWPTVGAKGQPPRHSPGTGPTPCLGERGSVPAGMLRSVV